ncbi:RHS repeat protein [Xenorhabdus bovienii]|uniref:RHS repeat domain-containing protein n=1 Tax=Xenorhabdus bovienii TaxID=40576 RepID=UPI001EDD47F9|nr:RHS repeat domain-containing protein [Xenorhabdus bovienii]MCG3470697.1 RHS repeat protein [Xenorhabdus bovienii]
MTINRGDNLHQKTPEVTVLDNRGLTVRELRYHRHPNTPATTDERITRHRFTLAGQLAHSIDPRLFDLQQTDSTVNPNMVYETALTGEVVRIRSVDAGNTLMLNDITGRPVLAINATEVTRTWQYEHETLPGRPFSITEQPAGEVARITERFVWAGNSQAEKNSNLVGQCVRHYDTAGLNQTNSIALNGVPLSITRQLLPDGLNADWLGDKESAWNDRLAPESFTTLSTADATSTVLTTTDAMGNVQRLAYDVAGLLTGSWLSLKGQQEQAIVKSLAYSATGQKLREEHGNGVVTAYTYEPETQRLVGIKTERPQGHVQGEKVLQDLRYEYDPVGNVQRLTNEAEATRFWRNQKVVPENTYSYDSLYQLVSATGREMANAGQQGSRLPSVTVPLSTDSSAYTNYTRSYTYDTGGNLVQIRHCALATNNRYTTAITVSDRSNRGVLSQLTEDASKVDALFTAGGHQKTLLPGRTLAWTPRGELLKVMPVTSEGAVDDGESYRYDNSSQRILKVNAQKVNEAVQTQRVVYLLGLELRTTINGSAEKENLQVITVGEAGQAQVRVLHWEAGLPTVINNDQIRYSYDNLLGSNGLEVDGEGNIINLEEYYPYGGTAILTARSQTEVDYKTVRYSGKERDATGLYYYGYRYYQPWAGRWLSADPAGTVDGLNLFRMVRNNPVSYSDYLGLMWKTVIKGVGGAGYAAYAYSQQPGRDNTSSPQQETSRLVTPGEKLANQWIAKSKEVSLNVADKITGAFTGRYDAAVHISKGEIPGAKTIIKGAEVASEAAQFAVHKDLSEVNKTSLAESAVVDAYNNLGNVITATKKVVHTGAVVATLPTHKQNELAEEIVRRSDETTTGLKVSVATGVAVAGALDTAAIAAGPNLPLRFALMSASALWKATGVVHTAEQLSKVATEHKDLVSNELGKNVANQMRTINKQKLEELKNNIFKEL